MKIDKEFQDLIPSLNPEEYKGLKESIEEEGCRDALVVWNDTLLDGHNRYKICMELDIPYPTKEVSLPDREAAKAWIERNQLNRRNLSPDQIRLIRGRLYNRTKKKSGGDRKSSAQNGPVISGRTADRLAEEFGVGHNTIKRDGKIAEYLSDHPEEEVKVLQGEKTLTEVKKEKKEMETPKKKKPKPKAHYITQLRLDSLLEKVQHILGLTDQPNKVLVPISTIRIELKKVIEELGQLEPYRKRNKGE